MSGFREIQPTQAIIPVRKPQDSIEREQQPNKEQKRKKEEQGHKDDDHKVDEFI